MHLHREFEFQPIVDPGDPDDWRPNSELAFVLDEQAEMLVVAERLAPGDAIPLHRHRIDEVVVYLAGTVQLRVGDEVRDAGPGDVAFVPAGTPHGMRNAGAEVAEFRAVFPTVRLDVEYLERNPAPGTEALPPRAPFTLDLRTGAVEPLA
jgi:quercetin dioxygenase-like cupin family protein